MFEHIPISPDRIRLADRASRQAIRYAIILWILGIVFFFLPAPFLLVTLPFSAFGFVFAILFWRRVAFRDLGLRRTQSPVLPYPLSVRYHIASGAIVIAGMAMFYQTWPFATSGQSRILPVFSIAAPFLAGGMGLLVAGYFAREPSPLSCPGCFYSVKGLTFPTDCPECGRPITSHDAAVGVIRARRPVIGGIGAALTAAFLILFIATLYRPVPMLNWIPKTNRITMAPSDRKVFRSLIGSNLTIAEASTLADTILDAERAGETNMRPQLDWVDAQLAAGLLTDAQALRYLTGDDGFSIHAEGRATVGLPITLRLNTSNPFTGRSRRVRAAYFFSGFEINPPVSVQQPSIADARLGIGDPLGPSARPAIEITPTAAGPMTMRTRVILIVTPFAPTPPTITWHDDGTYTITPPPVTTHEFTAETTLQVEP